MAKQEWHNWVKSISSVVVLIFACGITYSTVNDNSDDIDILQGDVATVKEDVHKLELSDKDIANMASKSLEFMVEIKESLKAIREKQTDQTILLDRTTTKLETLTKD